VLSAVAPDFELAKGVTLSSLTALGDEDVGGLDVVVNDAGGVSGVQRVGKLNGKGKQHFRLQRPARTDQFPGTIR
jgi:hypothetical protein